MTQAFVLASTMTAPAPANTSEGAESLSNKQSGERGRCDSAAARTRAGHDERNRRSLTGSLGRFDYGCV
ncbi:MAG: hypothetical protein C5B48_07040, partial [Candidatus Rokuibacteriota bacterium]